MNTTIETTIETVIITRHEALVQYIIETGIAPEGCRVIPHAGADDIRGRRVIGPLPLHLAALAASVVTIPLDVPQELRGVELTIDQVRQYARTAEEYVVRRPISKAELDLAASTFGPHG